MPEKDIALLNLTELAAGYRVLRSCATAFYMRRDTLPIMEGTQPTKDTSRAGGLLLGLVLCIEIVILVKGAMLILASIF